MCDTLIATADVTADGILLFGKNSDRHPNESQYLTHIPAADYPANSRVKCAYLEIPQIEHTYAVLLSRPFWLWGAEMGANEHGVVIGNEAVFTKMPYQKDNTLLGMDLLRLALERAATAREAVTVITDLLAQHNQGGNATQHGKLFYHNSFLIADPAAAWLLETAGPHWAAKQVKGVYTISNGLTIGREWDLASPNLVTYAMQRGWCHSQADFDFARCYSDFLYTRFSDCRRRCRRATALLSAQAGKITAQTVMSVLRDHGPDNRPPDQGLTGASVCMHAGFGPVRGSQTTASLVGHLHPRHPTYFFTGTAAPCTSLFKPVWLDAPLPDTGPAPAGVYDPATLYWRHEALHRTTLRDYVNLIDFYQAERDALEQEFVTEALTLAGQPAAARADCAARCLAAADSAEARWLERVSATKPQKMRHWLYALAWRKFNRQAGLPESKA